GGKDGEETRVGRVGGGGQRAGVTRRAKVRAGLQGSPRQLRGLRIAGIKRKLGYIRRDVHHQPVPEPAARGRIGIETGNGKALRAGGRSRPPPMPPVGGSRAAETPTG